jgi:hypothetical protein
LHNGNLSSRGLTLKSLNLIDAQVGCENESESETMPMYGDARVSAQDQNLTGQIAELSAAGCASIGAPPTGARSSSCSAARRRR